MNAQRPGISGEPFPTERYEALRGAVLGGATTSATNARGMAVFMRDGMTGWMRAWTTVAAPRARECDVRGARSAMPAEIVAVLAQMALAAAREVRT